MSEEITLEFNQFTNFGYLKLKIPNQLFLNLVKESEKFNINENEFKRGLSAGLGIAKHMQIKDSFDELSEFVLRAAYEYDTFYNYMSTIKILSKNGKLKAQEPWFNYQKTLFSFQLLSPSDQRICFCMQ